MKPKIDKLDIALLRRESNLLVSLRRQITEAKWTECRREYPLCPYVIRDEPCSEVIEDSFFSTLELLELIYQLN